MIYIIEQLVEKGEYIETVQSFLDNTCEGFQFEDLEYLGFIDEYFKYRVKSKKFSDTVIIILDPSSLEIFGCFEAVSSMCFHLGQLEYRMHF